MVATDGSTNTLGTAVSVTKMEVESEGSGNVLRGAWQWKSISTEATQCTGVVGNGALLKRTVVESGGNGEQARVSWAALSTAASTSDGVFGKQRRTQMREAGSDKVAAEVGDGLLSLKVMSTAISCTPQLAQISGTKRRWASGRGRQEPRGSRM